MGFFFFFRHVTFGSNKEQKKAKSQCNREEEGRMELRCVNARKSGREQMKNKQKKNLHLFGKKRVQCDRGRKQERQEIREGDEWILLNFI